MRIILTIICYIALHLNLSAQNIHRTACQGNLIRLDSMLSNTPITAKDNRGRSLLHWAVACKQKDVFNYLVEKGININEEDYQKKIPMHIAIHYSNEEYFDLLHQLQPNNNWIAKYGGSLMEKAVMRKNSLFIKKLVKSGIDINATNERGSTALEISQRIKSKDISKLLLALGADQNKVRLVRMKGKYMGQEEPGTKPKLFAPNFISTEEQEFGSVFSSDGTEFYYGVDVNGKNEIRYSRMESNEWTKPKTILSHERYGYNDPFLSNDENRLYFISKRALDGEGELKDVDIWYVEKTNNEWSEPINVGLNINTSGNEYYISFTNDGTLYFSSNGHSTKENKNTEHDILYSKFINGEFQQAVLLDDAINTPNYEGDVFVAPDESYMIFCSTRDDGNGRGDLYISFKNTANQWSKAINMGNEINTMHYEYCPFVTKDGKYLFYTSNQDIYWVSTEILNRLEKESRE